MVNEKRWLNALHVKPDDFSQFWENQIKNRKKILIILGLGWDPRLTAFTRSIKKNRGEGITELHLIAYKPWKNFSSPYKIFIDKNKEELNSIIENWASIKEIQIITRKAGNMYVGDEEIADYYTKFDISKYDEIIVDISSLTKSLYFTLLLILNKKCNDEDRLINLHVVACQYVELDIQILETADDTRYLKGFKKGLKKLSERKIPIIWAPLLAKNYSSCLKKLHEEICPNDIYPVFPFPSRNSREDDDLLIEYQEIFENEWGLNPLNLIYASEDDPLDVYRSLHKLYIQQEDTLKPMGGVFLVVSALSSKISSIGAFMAAADEERVAVAHSIGRHDPPQSMSLDFWGTKNVSNFIRNLHSIWLSGEPYE